MGTIPSTTPQTRFSVSRTGPPQRPCGRGAFIGGVDADVVSGVEAKNLDGEKRKREPSVLYGINGRLSSFCPFDGYD